MRDIVIRISIGFLCFVLLGGIASADPGSLPVLRVALRPVETVNATPEEQRRYRTLLEETLRATPGLALRPGSEGELGCDLREGACLRRLHATLGADRLLVLRVGRLGETVVIRLLVHDLAQGARQGSFQEVLGRGAGDREAREALRRMVLGFAPPAPAPPPARRRWYSRWWVWTIAGAVVAGSVTAAVLATRRRGDEPYVIITPPAP
jgi:hypothetical protein